MSDTLLDTTELSISRGRERAHAGKLARRKLAGPVRGSEFVSRFSVCVHVFLCVGEFVCWVW